MRTVSCGAAALTLAACLPVTGAWAAAVAGAAPAPELDVRPLAVRDLAPEDASSRPSRCFGSASTCEGPDAALSGWNLADLRRDVTQNRTGSPDHSIEMPSPDSLAYSPAASTSSGLDRSGHVPRDEARYRGFFQQAGTIKTELAVLAVYMGAQTVPKLFKETRPFHFKDEGWFGKDTANIGMDKLTHAFNTYLIANILHARLHRNTEASTGDALTAGMLAAGFMAINEVSDGIEADSGYSMQDIAMNLTGATLSVLRNAVPGVKEKLAFKIEIMPNRSIYSHVGKKHYAQQRFMLSIKGAGFASLRETPLRYLDFQVGYYASDFLNSDRAKGLEPKRHLFFGVGLNVGELLFGESRSRFGRAAHSVLDHVQLPYTSLRVDTAGEFGHW